MLQLKPSCRPHMSAAGDKEMSEHRKKRMRNPLRRRILRELTGEWTKYIVIALFLILTVGFVSGMYVANGSMQQSAEDSIETYRLEDGHFELKEEADADLIMAIESGNKADLLSYCQRKARSKADETLEKELGEQLREATDETVRSMLEEAYKEAQTKVYETADEKAEEEYEKLKDRYDLEDPNFEARPVTLYENFYREGSEVREHAGGDTTQTEGTIRVYPLRGEIDLPCIMDGALPASEHEIAIDRMHADNVGLKVGDSVTVDGEAFTVSGLVANVDYTTLFEKNTEVMFDAIGFDVGLLTQSGFDRLSSSIHYNYSFLYTSEAGNGIVSRADGDVQEKSWSDAFMKALITQAAAGENELKSYLPTYANQAVQFTRDDIGSDKAMGGVLLYVLIVVLAFIFAITIGNTIQKEASAVGTLRALGYTRGELLRHYMAAPLLVTLIAAVIGNIMGYTVFKDIVVDMYYNSYSLPRYETIFSSEALVKTTIIPVVLMFLINSFVIRRKLKATPLQFLRHDLKKSRRKRAMRLPGWKFPARFRLRVLLQNLPGYVVLFLGILFVMLMLAMAIGMPDTLDYYQDRASELVLADYQTVLTSWKDKDGEAITTTAEGAEKIGMKSLLRKSSENEESVTVYGMQMGSRYAEIPELAAGEVYISSAYAAKYGTSEGDTITLSAQFENASYNFCVAGVQEYDGAVAVFLPIEAFRETFELEEDAFSGYLSEEEITDIPSRYVASVITPKELTKMVDQLKHSMGSYMLYYQYLCTALAAVLMYLLTKLIIEANEDAISMTKILGYRTGEIASIYLLATTWVVIAEEIVGALMGVWLMELVWKMMMQRMEGWFEFVMRPAGYGRMLIYVFAAYLLVTILDFRRIRRIPMEEALKNVE